MFFVTPVNFNDSAIEGNIIIPKALRVGDKIYIVEISCTTNKDKIAKSRLDLVIKKLRNKGLEVVIVKDMFNPSNKLGLRDGMEQIRAALILELLTAMVGAVINYEQDKTFDVLFDILINLKFKLNFLILMIILYLKCLKEERQRS